jgi:integrase
MGKLTQSALPRLVRKPGRYMDGSGLFFRVIGDNKSYFVYRYRINSREREISLGPYPETSLDEARAQHAAYRAKVKREGVDPLDEKRAAKLAKPAALTVPSFGEVADGYVKTHEGSWQNDKHRWQWAHTLTAYCAPIRAIPVNQIDVNAVLSVLGPLWTKTPETASRLRGRIEIVLDAARALGHISADKANPARWRGHLDKLLPNPKKTGKPRRNHPAMAYADVPAFMARLGGLTGPSAKALMFAILTAARSGEVFGMTFDEIDFDAATWIVPAPRMKMRREHRVPLSAPAVAILRERLAKRGKRQVYVFESPIAQGAKVHRDGGRQPLSNMAFAMLLRRMGASDITTHGFRSSARSWMADHGVPFEVAESCLAHTTGNSVVQAYQRSDMLGRRRPVLEAWADFVTGEADTGKVVKLRKSRA